MSAREELGQLNNALQVLDDQEKKIFDQRWDLHQTRNDVIRRLIVEEKLLAGTHWLLKFNYSGKLYLEYDGHVRDDELKPVQELCWNGWHSDFKLDEKVRLDFDDSDVSLTIENSEDISYAIQTFGLVVDVKEVHAKAEHLRHELKALDETLARLS